MENDPAPPSTWPIQKFNLKDIKTGLRTNIPKPLQIDLDEEEKKKPFVSRRRGMHSVTLNETLA